ncbi:MAG: cell division protein FtsZ [Betaproteobacteria bacterium]|uniref:Cell division protein ZipA n=1 Tax=Candidatus Proximibacter danicus TaxID=2954365 RepID=A0A9D7PNZ8_9PROT|nr:cell division protein FtsZ [Candidatus Proximibacter danicus]
MSELQLGLIGLGTVAVIGVFAYNKWQEHRHRKVAEQVLQRVHADVLLDENREAGAFPSSPEPVDALDEFDASSIPRFDNEPGQLRDDAPLRASTMPEVRSPTLPPPSINERREPSVRVEPTLSELEDASVPPWQEIVAPATDDAVQEPSVASAAPMPARMAPESSMQTVSEALARTGEAPPEEVPAIIVSPVIDYMASFELVEEISGDQILRSQHELLARVSKPIGWAGYNDRTREWERVVAEGSYRRLRVGLLLANRQGPLGEADLLTFHGAMQNLADELMAVADLPPRDGALNAAIALDQFCANVDIQIGLNVISQGTLFPGTKIRALAEAAGMVLDSSGRFVRCDDDGNVLYTLVNQESVGFAAEAMKNLSTHGLVFILDVPCVSHGDRVFAQMLDLARRMADTLHGVLVDDNRRPLTEAMLDPFRRQIGQYQSQLSAKGLPAGSPLTQRLFA